MSNIELMIRNFISTMVSMRTALQAVMVLIVRILSHWSTKTSTKIMLFWHIYTYTHIQTLFKHASLMQQPFIGGWFPWGAWNIELTMFTKYKEMWKKDKMRLNCTKGNKKIRWFLMYDHTWASLKSFFVLISIWKSF
jgi:hypothetical protein